MQQSLPGLKIPTWNDVITRDYHIWEGSRYVIDTSPKSPEASLAELMSFLQMDSVV